MKRRLLLILLLLTCGAIINVAIAWGLGTVVYDGSQTDCILESDSGRPSELADIAICIADTWCATRLDCFKDFDVSGNWRWVADTSSQIPAWAHGWISKKEIELHTERHYAVYASGWPLRAMTGRVRIAPVGGDYMLHPDWTIILPPPKPMRKDQSRLLPLSPNVPGFAIDTLFYAAILWSIFAAPFSFRRWRRTKRGLCPHCAYPAGESHVCTECGKSVRGSG